MANTRGESRLCSVTYSQLAEWTGLSLHTLRTYATGGHFDRHDIESVLRWVNTRRAAKGLPLVGQPEEFQPKDLYFPECGRFYVSLNTSCHCGQLPIRLDASLPPDAGYILDSNGVKHWFHSRP